MRKAQGLPLNIVVMAAIALIVLVVILFIFTGRLGTFGESADSCASKQGECILTTQSCPGPIVATEDCKLMVPERKCCVKLAS